MSERTSLLRDEDRRVRRLRVMVSMASQLIVQRRYNRAEARQLVDWVRGEAVRLFPGKGPTFDLIYGTRFDRLIGDVYGDADRETVH